MSADNAAHETARPSFPERAIVTAGMPYGNKGLHFGHIAGVFVPADAFARFMRDRIGADNVMFVSGTDCYGSPINEGYRKLVEAGEFDGTIEDYVRGNHEGQKAALDAYDISLDIFEGSGIGHCGEVHRKVTDDFIRRLYENGFLEYRATAQFYDATAGTFLNGRQVEGRCPIPGCKSEHAYADECDLGHQYMPVDLINPKSTITGEKPEMRDVGNWYFKLPDFRNLLNEHVTTLEADPDIRDIVPTTMKEFLVPPVIFVKNECREAYEGCKDQMPPHVFREAEKGKQSFEIEFENIEDRDAAREVLDKAEVRYRAGKALVPFRITGNIDWGVPAPQLEGEDPLTVWCWPESLWAPISFSTACLEARGHEASEYKDWWCDPAAHVYQFIGQDNIYFYGVAQTALWSATQTGHEPRAKAEPGELQQTSLIANYHVLFMNKKASSSGKVKPPMAAELLNCYTPEQLRIHFLSLGLSLKPVSFSPKAFDPDAVALKDTDPDKYAKIADPVLKDGMILTNTLNRMVRGAFYAAQKAAGVTIPNAKTGEEGNGAQSYLPLGTPSADLVTTARKTLLDFERLMARAELHTAVSVVADYIRQASKDYNARCVAPKEEVATDQQLIDAFFLCRVCALLVHAIAPSGAEMICDYLGFDRDKYFGWDGLIVDDKPADEAAAISGNEAFCTEEERAAGKHAIKTLMPRTDFFSRHESQF